MKNIFNQKLLVCIFILILILFGFQIRVYATEVTENQAFTIEEENVKVTLNGKAYIKYSGGTGSITWESEDPSIATVSEYGDVDGLKIGTTTITATRGEETATCTVNVVYSMITIGGNSNDSITKVNLVLNEHDTENLYATVEDGDFETVSNAEVKWSSNNPSVVTVEENSGTITGVTAGTATITASAAGVQATCEVTVVNGPEFTDFSNAEYELLFDGDTDLKITGIVPKEESNYSFIITSNNTKPTITTSYGRLETDAEHLIINTEENYMYNRSLDKYVELNQDLYLWIIEEIKLEAAYAVDEENSYISYSTKFVVEGEKLTRPELPQLNLILKGISIWGGNKTEEESSWMSFRFPSDVDNRKFKLKIGKVTDNSILQKIQKNDYSGITDLLTYAKNNDAIYTADLITTFENYYHNENALFDGISLLQNKAYYYIYVEFDDEDGKYYPIEGVTLGQAWISSSNSYWDLWAYTSDNFEWNNLSSTPTEQEKDEIDNTKAPVVLPNTGIGKYIAIISVLAIVVIASYIQVKKLKEIK